MQDRQQCNFVMTDYPGSQTLSPTTSQINKHHHGGCQIGKTSELLFKLILGQIEIGDRKNMEHIFFSRLALRNVVLFYVWIQDIKPQT